MGLRLGANPIGWSNDDLPELGGHIPLETCLREARQAGFSGMELGRKFPREETALRAALGRHELDLVSGWYSAGLLTRTPEEELRLLRPHLDLLKAFGCRVLVFAETSNAIHGDRAVPLSRRPVLAPGDWADFAHRVTEVADRTLEEGLRLVYHHHMGTVVQSGEDIKAFMAAAGPSVGLLLDTGHAAFAGADPVALARRYKDRIGHVHAKDLRPRVLDAAKTGDMSFLNAVVAGVFTVPGDGAIDFLSVLRELAGFEGWLIVEAEQDPAQANPLTYAKMGYANLRRFAVDAGLL